MMGRTIYIYSIPSPAGWHWLLADEADQPMIFDNRPHPSAFAAQVEGRAFVAFAADRGDEHVFDPDLAALLRHV